MTTVRELPDATIRSRSVSAEDNIAYLVTCRATGAQLLVDAADDAPRLLALVAGDPVAAGRLDVVVTTHRHADHHRALGAVVAATGARTAAGRLDAPHLSVPVDVLLDDGDSIPVGALGLRVVHLRGHTPGSVALVLVAGDGSVHAFTGDSLFPGGVGNTHGNPADFRSLMDDVEHRLFDAYPDSTAVYPGHGAGTTLGAERGSIPQWRQRGW